MKVIYKDVFREIKASAGRFAALFLIIALGVAVYAGIRSSKPDMQISADTYYDETHLEDARVMSTLGLTEDDVKALAAVDGVQKAVGTYRYDFICRLGDSQYVVKMMALTDGINELTLKSGRMPQTDEECLIDDYYMNMRGYSIGDTIEVFSDDDTEVTDVINRSTFTICGSFNSSEYLSMSMGNTTIGSGKIEGLMAVRPSVFALDVFTEIELLFDGAAELLCYSEPYKDLVKAQTEKIEGIQGTREQARYDEVIGEANQKLDDAKKEYADGKQKYDDGKKEYDQGVADLENARVQYQNGLAQFNNGKVQIADGEAALQNARNELQTKKAALAKEKENTYAQLAAKQSEIDTQKENLERMKPYLTPEQYQAYKAQLDAAQAQLDAAKAQADAAFAQADAKIAEGEAQIASTANYLEQQKRLLADSEVQLAAAAQQIADAENTLASAKEELDQGEKDLKEAEEEIADAQKQIDEIKKPEWYILDRNYLTDYQSYESDAERIGNIGKVFPLIFFIVAALVCLTTMTRMVDEERTQSGTLKALGYGKFTIMRKYLLYALFATAAGSLVGALSGSKIFPFAILNVYKILYPNIVELYFPYNAEYCLTASLAALVCILAATLLACTKSLLEVPAALMRPVAPKEAKKLLLERIPGLWKRIPFNWKNAFRNFFRYKKRLFMTLFGICGSTALLLVGFGIKDAINTILYTQFEDIFQYNEVIVLEGDTPEDDKIILSDALEQDGRFSGHIYAYQTSVDAESANTDEIMSVYLFVPEDPETFPEYVDLRDRESQEKRTLQEDSVLISEKMALQLGLKPGDTFTISVSKKDAKTLTVGGIVENYVYHYIYMTPELYETLYGQSPEYNQILIKNNEGAVVSPDEFGETYLQYDGAGGVMCVETLIEQFEETLQSLNSITLILIVCAGALTFIVLFNLNNINISERRRELATLKVLGFYDIELSQYIYRENVLITLLGVALGVVGGIFLNRFVVSTIEVDIVMFGRQIFPMSYVYSVVIAIAFAAIVNIIVHLKLKKIDMATSLKSVE